MVTLIFLAAHEKTMYYTFFYKRKKTCIEAVFFWRLLHPTLAPIQFVPGLYTREISLRTIKKDSLFLQTTKKFGLT